MTKAIMSAISSELSVTDAFNLTCGILAASNISVSTKPGLMLCVQKHNIISHDSHIVNFIFAYTTRESENRFLQDLVKKKKKRIDYRIVLTYWSLNHNIVCMR